MSCDFIFYILWVLVHGTATLIALTRDVYIRLYDGFSYWCNSTVEDTAYLKSASMKWKKLPEHVTVLVPVHLSNATIDNSSENLDSLVKIVKWLLVLNIQYISFYDPMGYLHKMENDLQERIQKALLPGQRLIYHGAETKHKNGFSGPKIHVKLLNHSGRQPLVETCKELAAIPLEVTMSLVNDCQKLNYEFPDPQVAIYFGKYLNLHGYPPWQIRLTEFVNIPSLKDITVMHFAQVLEIYNKCEQRVGK